MHNARLDSILQLDPSSPLGGRETRGLDTKFAQDTYIETDVERNLRELLLRRRPICVVLCGNPGDGKTALLQSLLGALQVSVPMPRPNALTTRVPRDGSLLQVLFDGSASGDHVDATRDLRERCSSTGHLDRWFGMAEDGGAEISLLAINDGRLLEYLDDPSHRSTPVARAAWSHLQGDAEARHPPGFRLVDLNHRTLLASLEGQPGGRVAELLRAITGPVEAWRPCLDCQAAHHCPALASARIVHTPATLGRVAQRLRRALLVLERTGRLHITVRELRALLAAGFFGAGPCQRIVGADSTVLRRGLFWNLLFQPLSDAPLPLYRELARLDPAGLDQPGLDRRLLVRQNAPPFLDIIQQDPELKAHLEHLLPHLFDIQAHGEARRLLFILGDLREITDDPLTLLGVEEAWRLDPALGGNLDQLRDAAFAASMRIAGLPQEIQPGDHVVLGEVDRAGDETSFGWLVPKTAFRLESREPPGDLLGGDCVQGIPRLCMELDTGVALEFAADSAELAGRMAEGASPAVPEFQGVAEAFAAFGERSRRAARVRELLAIHQSGLRFRCVLSEGGEPPFLLERQGGDA